MMNALPYLHHSGPYACKRPSNGNRQARRMSALLYPLWRCTATVPLPVQAHSVTP